MTWEWRVGIRSYVYPLFIAFWYKILEFFFLDNTQLFVCIFFELSVINIIDLHWFKITKIYISPILHCFISSCGDLLFLVYAKKFFGLQIAYLSSICRTMSWFTIYMSPRSLTNSLEEILTIACLSCIDNRNNTGSYFKFHLSGFMSFIIRATSAINLIPIYFYQFFIISYSKASKFKLIQQFIIVGYSMQNFYYFL